MFSSYFFKYTPYYQALIYDTCFDGQAPVDESLYQVICRYYQDRNLYVPSNMAKLYLYINSKDNALMNLDNQLVYGKTICSPYHLAIKTRLMNYVC